MNDPCGIAVVTGAAGTIGRAIYEALAPSLTVRSSP
jgi:NAD(P)-dependent dehydrogenase (short-subunit alcohol dehydrogenase family)